MAPLLARVSKPKIRGHRGNRLLLVMFVIFWLLRQSIPADPLEFASTFPNGPQIALVSNQRPH